MTCAGSAALVLATAAVVPASAQEAAPAAAERQEVRLAPDAPARYVVVKGDTLWDISSKFLRDPWLWPEIWYVNPQVENPHLIYPGDELLLVYIDGKPRIMLERGADGSG
ncbi:MAG: LysM peptidoglycan-binding domain-containing protein, partial [Gammaproteobacteria bacterium]|nr:LysM peptidoglycan-binding domain-containing protein [Gammaproteobacteria bacterium]